MSAGIPPLPLGQAGGVFSFPEAGVDAAASLRPGCFLQNSLLSSFTVEFAFSRVGYAHLMLGLNELELVTWTVEPLVIPDIVYLCLLFCWIRDWFFSSFQRTRC